MKTLSLALLPFLALAALADDKDDPAGDPANPVAVITTSKGEIHVELWPKAAPKTVQNFLDLAEGKKEWKDPKTGEMVKRPFYDGLAFHRVLKDFMVQGGCPQGDGTGSAGYTFEDEINGTGLGLDKETAVQPKDRVHPWLLVQTQEDFQRIVVSAVCQKLGIKSEEDLKAKQAEADKLLKEITLQQIYELQGYVYDAKLPAVKPLKGVIAMANSGPNTNSSQFFLNLVDTPWLTGKHTVFGKIVKGLDVLEAIGNLKTDGNGRPVEEVKIVSIRRLAKADDGKEAPPKK
jgi:peptidyl-prolyl cis-trans isomerase A (cyclophilin A)